MPSEVALPEGFTGRFLGAWPFTEAVNGVMIRLWCELLEDGWDDEARTWTMPERGGGGGPAPVVDPIPGELFERIDAVKQALGVQTRGQAIKALLRFRDEEGEAWARFLGRWREEREREARR